MEEILPLDQHVICSKVLLVTLLVLLPKGHHIRILIALLLKTN